MSDAWDPQDAWAETYHTVQHLITENPQLAALKGKPVTLDLHFMPDGGTPEKFLRALKMFGFEGTEYEDDATIEVSIANVSFSAEAIWEHEEKLARLALAQNYRPDGWGFAEP